MDSEEFVGLRVEKLQVCALLVDLIASWHEHFTFPLIHIPKNNLVSISGAADGCQNLFIAAERDSLDHLLVKFDSIQNLKRIEIPDD